jgi:hypothetical protein
LSFWGIIILADSFLPWLFLTVSLEQIVLIALLGGSDAAPPA